MNRRIVLVGFMGCGKTSVARELARRLDWAFVDLDSVIHESQGRTAAQIIHEDSEAAFRAIETQALADVLNRTEMGVIALGGGTWIIPANRDLIEAKNCLSIWLDAPFELCWQRISSEPNTTRPLAPDRETAQARFDSRRADYALAKVHINLARDKQLTEILDEISRSLSIN